MSPPGFDSLENLSVSELRALVSTLLGQFEQLRNDNEALRGEIAALKSENQTLKDEIARLKGLPPRPHKPSGMEKSTHADAGAGKKRGKSKRRRGATRDKLKITDEIVLKTPAPAGSRFKGYEDIFVQDLNLSAQAIRFRRERWTTPSGETLVASLPSGVVGGFGPNLRRFILACHIQGQVTTERLTALLNGVGIVISKRQVVRLLTESLDLFAAEEQAVLRTGLSTAPWITVDDTGARHAKRDGYTTQIGDDRFTAFRTGYSKSRANFLAILRAGCSAYVVNQAALDYMRGRNLPATVIDKFDAHAQKIFADEPAWKTHLESLGLVGLNVTPDPVAVATEGALWGAVHHQGLLADAVVVSDGAGQFRVGAHALCWVHAERLVHKLAPETDAGRRAVEIARQLIWWFYGDLKAYKRTPCPRRAAALRARFDRIFKRKSGYVMLDRLMARLLKRKSELLRVLERPEIPLHTNGSENDIRAVVTKRKISGGTVSDAGRDARDILLGLMKTCAKLRVSFFHYLGDRLGVVGAPVVARLPDLMRAAATT
jgi:hypothetical protein